jgi:hypothetical protein
MKEGQPNATIRSSCCKIQHITVTFAAQAAAGPGPHLSDTLHWALILIISCCKLLLLAGLLGHDKVHGAQCTVNSSEAAMARVAKQQAETECQHLAGRLLP